jgi:hypothetical protein
MCCKNNNFSPKNNAASNQAGGTPRCKIKHATDLITDLISSRKKEKKHKAES